LRRYLAPHIILDTKLKEAADSKDSPLGVMTGILRTARIAELSSFGRIADDRIRVIKSVEEYKDKAGTSESVFQNLIQEAPWLIDPQWSPIVSNQTFNTLRLEFQKYYERLHGKTIELQRFNDGSKRADFILSSYDRDVQIIEIKKPFHPFENEEMERLNTYIITMEKFLTEPTHKEFLNTFKRVRTTLVCDSLKLTGVYLTAFEGLTRDDRLRHIDWKTFLLRTRKMHEEFLTEADRQKRDAARRPMDDYADGS